MGNIVTIVKRFSRNNSDDVPFRRYSSLSYGTPSTWRLDTCTLDKDSLVTEKTAPAISTGANGCESVGKAVDKETIGLTTCSSSTSGCFTLSIAHTEPSGGDEQGQGKPNETIHKDAIDHGSVSRPAIAGFKSIPRDSGNFEMEAVEDTEVCHPLNVKGPESNPNTNETIHKDAIDHGSVSRPAIAGFKSIPRDSGNFEMEAVEDTEVCHPLNVKGPESNPNTSLKRRAKRKSTSRKASAKKIVPTGNVGTSASPDVKYPEMVRSPLTRSKAMALSVSTTEYHRLRSTRMGHLVVPPSHSGSENVIRDVAKLPIIQFVEQSSADKALQLTPPMIRTPLPHVRSILTPSRAMVHSLPTLETLQLKRSRSGRLIVPRLDPGTQDIIYNMDGSLCGITNSELQLPPVCYSEPPAKRRRKSLCPSQYRGRLLQFDGK